MSEQHKQAEQVENTVHQHIQPDQTRLDLANSQIRLRAMIEAAIDFAIITIDPQGTIRDWSPGAEQMFGHTASEAIGQNTALLSPVTAIKAYSEVLQDVLGQSGDENVAILRKLNGQVDRLTKLIETLLDSSTITEGKMTLHPETFDLSQLIEEQVETYQRIAGNKTIRWSPEPVAFVHADRDRIVQVVTNFVSNAVKYSPANAEIVISTHDKLDSLMLCVKDNGPGIEKEAQHFLFDRYFRVAGEPRKLEGIGLGLYISAAIIRQHNGAIGVESAPGEGSVFFFTLPYS